MENHSYQKWDVDMLLAINDEIEPLIQKVLNAVDGDKYSYKQKETALHVVNEILFHKLIN
ncbi:hypothetical protein H5S40_03515 [Limosilactobacillus sp. RRLNB_1_1]|uniref:Uncharacterized protein n=1 Tax=Limosilactobacillus albertensis TaxID=2759752 RepID=A0A7W3Y887_9LACO|nr:hypothetical protein [Limosilactobacillus albertensis]MBB1069222.1 hypothetical protein [Limosilactobacillus albertensis]MCD7118480.1 hypothetical protein [Limosilactobacillus albertensis]MCD7128623.1 hypothetical protein [Limosilactobacillus albertensis]